MNRQAQVLEDAQSKIRLLCRDAFLQGENKAKTDRKALTIIQDAIASITINDLKQAAFRSLSQFYQTQRRIAEQTGQAERLLYLALSKLSQKEGKTPSAEISSEYTRNITITQARAVVQASPYIPERDKPEILNYGQALNKYHEHYIRDNIRPMLDRMCAAEALDPESEDYLERRSTLRNRAEREVRYQDHINKLEDFKSNGTKLVICSAHANCSERCRPWQSRVFSLDGTKGTTPDGRPFVPLEVATNIRTKNGKWNNGLFGFNCRHYLIEYKDGRTVPKPSAQTEAKQYAIDQRQRALERNVRKWRIREEMAKGTDPQAYRTARAKAKAWNDRYIAFSKANQRAYYPSRTKLL